MGSRESFVAGAIAGAAALLIFAVPAAAAVSVGHAAWNWGNPLPQGNDLRALEFIGNRGYAAGEFGTLLRTDDAGATWTGIRTGVTRDLGRLSIIDSDSLVVAGGCAVRRSDNAGQSFNRLPWTASDLNCPEPIVSLSFPTDRSGYLLIADGNVFSTLDGGSTWSRKTAVPGTRATGGSAGPTDVVFTGTDTGVATTSTGRIYRTADAGGSWTLERNHPQVLNGLTFVNAKVGYAVGDASSVLKTTDGGLTWTQTTGGALRITSIRCVDEVMCLATVDPGDRVLRTFDGGATFASVTPSTEKIFAAAFASSARAVAVGAFGTTVVSNDAGTTWGSIGGRISGEFTRLRAQSSALALAAGRAGVLARTSDAGASWTTLGVTTSDDVVDASFPDERTGFALDSAGSLLRTDNAGASWQILNTGTTRAPLAVLALDADRVLLFGPRGIRRSTDGGREFAPVRSKRVSRAVLFDFDRGRCLFAHGARDLISSSNAGRSWRDVRLPVRPIVDVDFVSCRKGYLLSTEQRIYQTRNGGRRWKELLGLGPDVFDIAFSSFDHGYATATANFGQVGAYVFRTFDAGKSWRPELVNNESIDGERPLVASRDAGRETALLLAGDKSLFTTAGATAGTASTLKLDTKRRRLRRSRTIEVAGRLTPAEGGEQVVLSMRESNRPSWRQRTVTAASNGAFTSRWKIQRSSFFIAQWSGDDEREGDGSAPLEVTVRRR